MRRLLPLEQAQRKLALLAKRHSYTENAAPVMNGSKAKAAARHLGS